MDSGDLDRDAGRITIFTGGPMSNTNERLAQDAVDHPKERRRERLYAAYQEAANDPAYVREMGELTAEFECAVDDGLD
jgi:hypothetical protein